jgi:peptidyl-prolyl cis-trans isomerase C
LLGEVKHGQLYAELESELFELEPMQLSGVVESPLGLHLLRCDKRTPARKLTLGEVQGAIRELLFNRRKRICQNAWLKQIQQNAPKQDAKQQTRAA